MHRIAFFSLLLGGVACTTAEESEEVYELVFSEEFDGDEGAGPPERDWNFDIGRGNNGWGNNELQFYTNRVENIGQTGDGELRFTMLRENPGQDAFEGAEFTSARITTKDKVDFRYGRVEARVKTPVERAVWPAFWMLGADIDEVGWPDCGEIDIMEVFGTSSVGVALHGRFYNGENAVGFPVLVDEQLEGWADDFHTYEIIWDPQVVVWRIDGEEVALATPADLPPSAPWLFDHEFYMLLNLAVGGNPVNDQLFDSSGNPILDSNDNPVAPPDTAEMLVDYVRVYQRVDPLLDPVPQPLPGEE